MFEEFSIIQQHKSSEFEWLNPDMVIIACFLPLLLDSMMESYDEAFLFHLKNLRQPLLDSIHVGHLY